MYYILSMSHDWPVKKAIVDLPILELQNALPVIRQVQVGSVRFGLFGISLNTVKMKYVI